MSTPELPEKLASPKILKVAQIVTAQQLVLAGGADDGVSVGLRYNIIHSVDVYDPDDPKKKILTLEYSKATVEITQVFDAVSVAIPPASAGVDITIPRSPLNVDPKQVAMPDDALVIRVGDLAKLETKEESG